ncbi:uncharacterized protein LOC114286429 [Camellia sinensis]|uniref:uncharacterized protein LOC114286429 n=1 Tax=Camellia sinensis TaxID=4442 RepID=UPI00103584E0|nr:uncharacterized protein LOC114286429 [Camellia sinensis]
MTIVGEAIGCQVAWPKKFTLVNNEGALKDVDCEKRLECIPAFASLVGNERNSKNVDFEKKLESIHAFESLVEHFKYDEAINIPLEKDIFGEEISVQLQRVDMECVCQMKELSITCIMLYISGLWIYGITKGMNRKPIWQVVECPQQLTSVECGFYVMRYMKDLIRDQSILSKTNFNGKKTCMEFELDEVRVEWINFILDNM